jgi:lysozyme family protein
VSENDPIAAQRMIEESELLLPSVREKLKAENKAAVELVKTQAFADELTAKFGTDSDGMKAAWSYIDKHFTGEERTARKRAYNAKASEVQRLENMRESEEADRQNANYERYAMDFFANGRVPESAGLDRLLLNKDISLPQYERLVRWQETAATRAGITKRLSRTVPGWHGMTPQQKEEAVMLEAGRTDEERNAALDFIEAGILDGDITNADLTAAYNDMYITSSELERYKKASGVFKDYEKTVGGIYKKRLDAAINNILDNLTDKTKLSDKALRSTAMTAFYEAAETLDPKDPKYEEKLQGVVTNALGAMMMEMTDEPLTEWKGFRKVETDFARAAREAPAGAAAPAGVERPEFVRDAIDLVLDNEGGYVNDPDDRGGETNFGVTKGTLDAARKQGIVSHNVSKDLTKEEASKIYEEMYAKPMRIDELPMGVGAFVMDMGVNQGPQRAVKVLQRVLDVKQTGKMDDATIEAAREVDPGALIDILARHRLGRYDGIIERDPAQKKFKNGWYSRTYRMREAAKDMAAGAVDELDRIMKGGDGR